MDQKKKSLKLLEILAIKLKFKMEKVQKKRTKEERQRFYGFNPWEFFRERGVRKGREIIDYNRRLASLSKITKSINSEARIGRILRLILKSAVGLTESDYGVIFFRKGYELEAVRSHKIRPRGKDLIIKSWRGIVGHVFKTKKAYYTNDTRKDKYFVPWESRRDALSELSVPIIISRRVEGILIVGSRKTGKYGNADTRITKDLAESTAITLKKVRDFEELNRLKRFSDKIINSSSLGMLITDNAGRTIRYNRAAKTLFSSDLLRLGKKIEFPSEVNLPAIDKIIKKIKSEKKSVVFENILHRIKKSPQYYDLRVDPLFTEHGELESILLTKENITKRVILEQKIREINVVLEKKVRQRTRRLKSLNKRLKKSIDARMQFVADVSHELRTPLTIIRGNIELLLQNKDNIPTEKREAMKSIVGETKSISKRLDSLIDLIHERAEDERIEMRIFRFDKLIREVIERVNPIAREKRLKIILKNNPEVQYIGDREKIKEVLLNIITNAIKYNRIWGKIWVNVEQNENKLKIECMDTGVGISKEDLPFIFDRFYRAKEIEAYKKKRGSGIGLAVSRWVIKAHGGQIKVKSKSGKGTHFTILLPLPL